MKLATIEVETQYHPAVVSEHKVYDLSSATSLPDTMLDIISEGSPCLSKINDTMHLTPPIDISEVKFAAPIRYPRKLIALAGNYMKHIAERGYREPTERQRITQQLFMKPPTTTVIGHQDPMTIPTNMIWPDWEVELGIVIGRGGRNITKEKSYAHVFGYTILNDITDRQLNAEMTNRDVRERDPFFDWLAGKWFDGSAPMGPWIVTADEIPDPHNLKIQFSLNGKLMQNSNTANMIFQVPDIIAYASSIMTLEPGDVIFTGTPEGIGKAQGIKLKKNDQLKCEIEHIGVLENHII